MGRHLASSSAYFVLSPKARKLRERRAQSKRIYAALGSRRNRFATSEAAEKFRAEHCSEYATVSEAFDLYF